MISAETNHNNKLLAKEKYRISVLGGLPAPIGGVTSFIYRLAAKNLADRIIDIYPSDTKQIPQSFRGETIFLKNFASFLFHYLLKPHKKTEVLHLNFSTTRALLLVFLIPKLKTRLMLTLHHGVLTGSNIIYRMALKKIDVFFCMSDIQLAYYKKMGIAENFIVKVNSYIPPVSASSLPIIPSNDAGELKEFFKESKVAVCSGSMSNVYNHEWCVEYVAHRENLKLAIFIYGENIKEDFIQSCKARLGNRVMIFQNKNSNFFNNALKQSFLYLRPTSKDSFGIAVADAINFNVSVVASDVCHRYPGTHLFKTSDKMDFFKTTDDVIAGRHTRRSKASDYLDFSYKEALTILEKNITRLIP